MKRAADYDTSREGRAISTIRAKKYGGEKSLKGFFQARTDYQGSNIVNVDERQNLSRGISLSIQGLDLKRTGHLDLSDVTVKNYPIAFERSKKPLIGIGSIFLSSTISSDVKEIPLIVYVRSPPTLVSITKNAGNYEAELWMSDPPAVCFAIQIFSIIEQITLDLGRTKPIEFNTFISTMSNGDLSEYTMYGDRILLNVTTPEFKYNQVSLSPIYLPENEKIDLLRDYIRLKGFDEYINYKGRFMNFTHSSNDQNIPPNMLDITCTPINSILVNGVPSHRFASLWQEQPGLCVTDRRIKGPNGQIYLYYQVSRLGISIHNSPNPISTSSLSRSILKPDEFIPFHNQAHITRVKLPNWCDKADLRVIPTNNSNSVLNIPQVYLDTGDAETRLHVSYGRGPLPGKIWESRNY